MVSHGSRSARVTVALVGTFMSLGQFALLYMSLHVGMPPGLAALVLQAQVVFTIVIAAVGLRERPSRAQVTGVGLGVLGLAVVAVGIGGKVPLIADLGIDPDPARYPDNSKKRTSR
jgi:O-acetylserine/cysteine efflux transporter